MDGGPGAGPARRRTGVVRLRGPLGPQAVERACVRLSALLLRKPSVVVCAVRGQVDLGVVDALARLQLLARRAGASLAVEVADDAAGAGPALDDLLALTGLQTALGRPLQPGGQAEAGEQAGVEEVVDVRDAPA